MGVAMTPPNKLGRRMHDALIELGYRYAGQRRGGHFAYEHDEQETVFVSGTSYDRTGWQAFKSEMRRRHPGAFEERKASPEVRAARREQKRAGNAPQAREPRRRLTRDELEAITTRPSVATRNGGVESVVSVPNPGSPEAMDQGCRCSRVDNRNGVGVEGHDGVFEMRGSCPLHGAEVRALLERHDNPQPETNGRVCECGNPLMAHKGRGRPRKWCQSCRPSWWRKATEEQREASRARVRRWSDRQEAA
jgi:hypothetical protein